MIAEGPAPTPLLQAGRKGQSVGTGGHTGGCCLCLIVHLTCLACCRMGARVSLLGRDQERAVARQPEASNGVTPLLGGYQEQSQACLATLVLSMTHLCPHAVCVSGGSLSGVALS